eukprot:4062324-Pyramimonas_sp.AAC.1
MECPICSETFDDLTLWLNHAREHLSPLLQPDFNIREPRGKFIADSRATLEPAESSWKKLYDKNWTP